MREKELTKVKIAAEEGVSKARMAQLFSLLRLPEDARQHLVSLTSPAAIQSFAVRRLMAIAKLPSSRQQEVFEEMKVSSAARCGG